MFYHTLYSYLRKTEFFMESPKANIFNKSMNIHGYKRVDPYYWLRERENPEVISYLQAENAYTNDNLQKNEPLKTEIYNEIVGRIKQHDTSVPYKRNDFYYQTVYEEGKEYPIYTRAKNEIMSDPEILLDANKLGTGHEYYQIGGFQVSYDNLILAYSEDSVGRRLYKIRFIDKLTGEFLPWEINNTCGGVYWSLDNQYLFFVEKDEETLRPFCVKRWSLKNPDQTPVTIFTEHDETYYLSVELSISEKCLLFQSESTLTSEVQVLFLNKPLEPSLTFMQRAIGHEYSIEHEGNKFYIRTNKDGRNFALYACDETKTSTEYWQNIVAHHDERLLENFTSINGHVIVQDSYKAQTNISIISESNTYSIPFDEEVYVVHIGTNADPKSSFLRFMYTSMTTPTSIYDFDFNTKTKTLKKQEEIVGGYNRDTYKCERLWVTSRDGVSIPVSIVYNKDSYKKNESPLLLYGYGSYGHSIDPGFGLARLSLLDRGFAFAIAHIRGGEEMGRKWYEDGRQLHKMNTFNDFIDCGKYLVEKGVCSKDKLFAMGGSAGGLLMGAVINMEPKMWAGIVAAVPFVDVLTTMLDDTIPLTTGEYDEWGNPNIKEYYEYMAKYSPYDNVVAQDYPNMLVTTGLHDSQVQYWEPAKWVAKLRALKTDQNSLFLKTNMDAGHGGASGRFKRYDEIAFEYAFLLELNAKNTKIEPNN